MTSKKFFVIFAFRDWVWGIGLPMSLNKLWSFIIGKEIDLSPFDH